VYKRQPGRRIELGGPGGVGSSPAIEKGLQLIRVPASFFQFAPVRAHRERARADADAAVGAHAPPRFVAVLPVEGPGIARARCSRSGRDRKGRAVVCAPPANLAEGPGQGTGRVRGPREQRHVGRHDGDSVTGAEAPVQQCQFCQGQVEKMISLSSFQLTGSGWYVTDYGGKKSCALDSRQKEATGSSSDAAPSCSGGESSCCAGCKAAE